MYYPKCKIYNDGGHFIAIPPTTRPFLRKRPKPLEKLIAVVDRNDDSEAISDKENCKAKDEKSVNKPINNIKDVRLLTKKELFNELYEESSKMKKRKRKAFITSKMTPYFNSEKETRQFVEDNFARQLRNLICRKTRLYRKARLQTWNYFCTFTYDSAKHTEESFRKKLSDTFKKMCYRRGWKYIGVWERSVEKERLHFHGLFYIPDGVTSIGSYAFRGCSSLKTVFYKGTAAQWGKISIGSDNGYLTSATKIYNYDDIIRNYSFVTNCEQTIEPIFAKYIETLPVITRNDYYFGGWYDNAELNGTPVNAPYYSKEKTTLYAKWWTEEEWNELHNGTSFDKAFIAESGKSYIVNITSGEQIVYFAFTATESKSYTIQSTGSCDTCGTLYSSSKSSLSTDDDSGSGSNFSITYSMSAGNTYYVAVNFFYGSSTTGSFTVQFS